MAFSNFAEQEADKARNLQAFHDISLIGIRDKVKDLLALIGKIDSIFSTYTLHDISHIDGMLKMLDWLIPPSTKRILTPADWLLIVLAIYLHDLGLLVTANEYEKRNKNEDFLKWFNSLRDTIPGRDYIDRTRRMTIEEKEKFFYQEYVRKGHATRIREWITGNHSRKWGAEVQPIVDAISNLLAPLPSRFREYLGLICESHHNDNLDRLDIFPLCAPSGNETEDLVNVQYAAILLRTTDLLHVTQERTPSVMYQIIHISDPKGVTEWDKQRGTFAVRQKGRQLIESDPDTAVVVIHADFTEESPLFALQEYIAYANSQVIQSKRWADVSQTKQDARAYSFPWNSVKGDVRLEGVPPLPLSFELDRGRLLDLLVGHTIYNDPTVAVRELIQNSLDAVRFQYYLDLRKPNNNESQIKMGNIKIFWQKSSRMLTVIDNGTGMDSDIIHFHLMRVGASFYATEKFRDENRDFSPISRFGIGILTNFMVSDDIELVTCRDGKGYRIRMTSVGAEYLLRELPIGDSKLEGIEPHGTRVTLRIRDSIDLTERGIREILKYWVILPECTVNYIEDDQTPERIGYDNPAKAYEELQSSKDSDNAFNKSIKYITKLQRGVLSGEESLKNARYELTFPVTNNFLMENVFNFSTHNGSIVCVEGIRVSNNLPWFNEASGLLSVRGDSSFKTTVSRSGLEEDKEYDRIGTICALLFLEHIKDEINRISNEENAPLSKAALSASQQFRYLNNSINTAKFSNKLEELYQNIGSIVIERTNLGDVAPMCKRELVSKTELIKEKEVWTIESRVIDSIGIISRDLGRELSPYEFLNALAPETKHLTYTPLLPDAHFLISSLGDTHIPVKVEFSRKHFQTATKWIPIDSEHPTLCIPTEALFSYRFYKTHSNNDEFINSIERTLGKSPVRGRKVELVDFEIADFAGDDPNVEVVITRLGTILKSGSVFGNTWLHIVKTLKLIIPIEENLDLFIGFYKLISQFKDVARGEIGEKLSTQYWQRSRVYNEKKQVNDYFCKKWTDQAQRINSILSDLHLEISIPTDTAYSLIEKQPFNATSYWKDWTI